MRILLIDVQAKLTEKLRESGFAVDYIENRKEAIRHFYVHHPSYDAVVWESDLSRERDFEVCMESRNRGIITPILVVTPTNAPEAKAQILNAGADDLISQSCSYIELEARLNALMRRPQFLLPTELIVGDMRLSTMFHRIFIDARELKVTAKEFSILEYMMRQPERVFDRETIIEHVWDFNYNAFSNIVDVHIKNIRNKIRRIDPREFIETVENVGYRLTAHPLIRSHANA